MGILLVCFDLDKILLNICHFERKKEKNMFFFNISSFCGSACLDKRMAASLDFKTPLHFPPLVFFFPRMCVSFGNPLDLYTRLD